MFAPIQSKFSAPFNTSAFSNQVNPLTQSAIKTISTSGEIKDTKNDY